MLFDAHAHLDDAMFDTDREQMLSRFIEAGGGGIIAAGANLKTSAAALALAQKHPFIYAACGIHPQDTDTADNDFPKLEALLRHEKCVAVGEIGLDYHYDTPARDVQKYWFEKQLKLAEEMNMPIVIHDREAHEDCLAAVRKYDVKGVFHCYSGSVEMAKELIALGFYLSFSGVVTFKNAKKAAQVVQEVPLDRILIETDCPYLAPEPNRGKRNEPSFVRYTAQHIARLRGIDADELAKITYANTLACYHIKSE